ncbi:hypothetical protein PSTT_15636 [Puccinia striiformis]|uniref:Uncharacterized protein n=1 Tax=Puccinia striiformis TaxID=27350 RepID=A0A2S4UH37_9BASI|nr:hypothetical protein PSTT_15636 [Puccinia striiformis]
MENLGLFDLTHSIQVGIRAAIIVPTCELALQVLKVMKVVVVPIEKEAVLSVLIGIVVDYWSKLIDGTNQTKAISAACSSSNHCLFGHQTSSQIHRWSAHRVSLIYSALDQIARCEQLQAFCLLQTNILVVTDLPPRDINIQILENVINFDFASSAWFCEPFTEDTWTWALESSFARADSSTRDCISTSRR